MPPADKKYWDEVAGENLRLYQMIQKNSGQKPHHTHKHNSFVGKRVSTSQSHVTLPAIHPTPRSHRPSEKQYWADVSRENRRLLRKILDIQVGKRKRSESSPPIPIYPAPRRYYPNEVLYWKGVSQENNRLLNKIFRIDKGKLIERKPVTMSARSRSRSSSRERSCSLENSSTYFAEYGRKCGWRRKKGKTNVEVEVAFEDPDTGNIIREIVEMNLNTNRNRGTMTEFPREHRSLTRSTEDIIAEQLVAENMPVDQVKRAINAIADEIYRPPWK